jgi:hypothetical protein
METVCVVCNKARESTKQGVSFQKLKSIIRKEFKAHSISLKIRTKQDKYLDPEVFYTNGYYDPEDDKENECPIEVIITHNFDKDALWGRDSATRLLIQIFDTVVHELRHQRQYRKRRYRPGVQRDTTHHEYLADLDEVDAYSISIAIELCRTLGKTRALRYLHNINLLSRFKLNAQFVSPSLGMYRAEFPNPDNVVIKRLAKKVYVRLMKVDTDAIFS